MCVALHKLGVGGYFILVLKGAVVFPQETYYYYYYHCGFHAVFLCLCADSNKRRVCSDERKRRDADLGGGPGRRVDARAEE